MTKISIKKSWGTISRHYQRKNIISTEDIHYGALSPGERELKLLGDVRGKDALELGCGGGQNTIALSRWGANAVGLDISEEQIKFARMLAKEEGIEASFYVGSMEDLSTFHDSSRDIVISSFAIAYVKDLRRTFREAFRVLRDDGTFVFCDLHPIASRGRKVKLGRRWVWSLGDYFDRRRQIWCWPRFEDGTTARFFSYHRTVQDYFDALIEEGFTVERILEPEPYGVKELSKTPCLAPDVAKDHHIWRKIPYTILIKSKKARR